MRKKISIMQCCHAITTPGVQGISHLLSVLIVFSSAPLISNARFQPLPQAGARYKPMLEAVGCKCLVIPLPFQHTTLLGHTNSTKVMYGGRSYSASGIGVGDQCCPWFASCI